MASNITIFCWRQELRLSDNLGPYAGTKSGPALPVYILCDYNPGIFGIGSASKLWLHRSLSNLNELITELT